VRPIRSVASVVLQVTLIDKADKFVFKPLLYEVVNGTATAEDVAPTYVKLLSPYTVNFVQVTCSLLANASQHGGMSACAGIL